jgi:hypothetical protein
MGGFLKASASLNEIDGKATATTETEWMGRMFLRRHLPLQRCVQAYRWATLFTRLWAVTLKASASLNEIDGKQPRLPKRNEWGECFLRRNLPL